MSATRIDKEEWSQADMIMRWPPEFLKIVGKHSQYWNYPKMETLLQLDEWLQDYVATAQHQLLDELMELSENYEKWTEWSQATGKAIKVEAVPVSAIEALKEGLK